MWIRANPNPAKKEVGDCVIRAISIATGKTWMEVFDELCETARSEYDMPSADEVWGLYLYRLGFHPFLLPNRCPVCMTVREFAQTFQTGTFIIGSGNHAVAVIDGNWIDSWNSANTIASFFWAIT